MVTEKHIKHAVPLPIIVKIWWPLAASWLLMGIELPALSAIVARLPEPEINLAAYGGIVFPLALIIEAPIIMLLAASTALSKDWASFIRIRRFMMIAGAVLTALHILVAFTPVYDWVARDLLGVPAEIIEPGRIGLKIMTPWTWSIAYRRFHQGVMIRFGHSGAIGIGTVVRLLANSIVLTVGYLNGSITGIVVATTAVAAGVISEAVYTGIRVKPILRNELRASPPVELLTWKAFYQFYVPLALTSLLTLVWQPIGSAALSRMPDALPSLAVWPVVSGLIFMLRSLGIAYNEVVVAVLDRDGSYLNLRRFKNILIVLTTLLHLMIAATPLSYIWFYRVSALPLNLAELAQMAFLLALPMAALSVLQSWYQGAILNGRNTRSIPESVVIFLITVLVVLGGGIWFGGIIGLYVGIIGFVLANLTQTIWLWWRSQPVIKGIQKRDAATFEEIPFVAPAG
jgi:hypothetical protein